jgi:hypothetical protein
MDPTTSDTDAPQADDRFLAWPFFAVLGVALLLGLICAYGGLVLVMALFAIPVASVVALGALVLTGLHVRGRRWRRAVSMLIVPTYLALIPLAPAIAVGPFVRLGFWAHFLSMYSTYEAELVTLPQDTPRFRVFDWGGFGGVNEFIVYDETDGIALPPAQRHDPISENQGVCGDGPALRIVGHYYFC